MMVFLVLGACILGAILLLIFVLRALYNKALGVEKNPTAEKPSEEEERLLSPSSEYERPCTVSVPVDEPTIRLKPRYEKEYCCGDEYGSSSEDEYDVGEDLDLVVDIDQNSNER